MQELHPFFHFTCACLFIFVCVSCMMRFVCVLQDLIASATGFDPQWQRLFDADGSEISG